MDTIAEGAVSISEVAAERHDSGHKKPASKGQPAGPPLFRRRPAEPCRKAETIRVDVTTDLWQLLSHITKNEPLLEYASVAAALNVCLHRYTKSTSIAVGAPAIRTAGDKSDEENVIVVVNELNGQMTFRQLLLAVRQSVLDAYARNDRFVQILAELEDNAPPNRCLLFDVALVVPTLHYPMPEINHDITLTFHNDKETWLEASFSAELYEPEIVENFCRHILQLLHSGLESTNTAIAELAMLSPGEKHRLLSEWNNTATDHAHKCIHEIFEDYAERQPDKIALVCGDRRLTYRELNEQANQMAHYLRRMEIGPDTLIGIFLNRSIELVIGILGTLKAGAAYVPYDPTYPKDRLAAMFEDLKPRAVLTNDKMAHRIPDAKVKVIRLDGEADLIARESTEKPAVRPQQDHLCYVIFTSGSTGRAKAAAVHHGGWSNLLYWFVRQFDISPVDKTLVMSSISFDITQRAMAMPLTSGGELHLLASEHYEPDLIMNTIVREKITLLNCAPSTFYPMIEGPEACSRYQNLSSLRCLFLGGEAISASRLKSWAASAEGNTSIVNVYGAAECSDVSSFYVLHEFDRYIKSSVPIGTPIFNTQIYIVDEEMQLVPIGIPGEICLAGDGVGKGYINDAALTAKKFPQDSFAGASGKRLYRTGDVARYLLDGSMEFMGRIDSQVKIRGQRVELGEVETILREDPRVKEAVMVQSPFSDDHQRLIAYVVLKEAASEHDGLINELRAGVGAKLPPYMVPNAFVILDAMPLNPNGKVDRAALPAPGIVRSRAITNPATTATEQTLAKFYMKLLGIENVGVTDNFFDLGGHSLLVTQMLALIGDEFEMQMLATDFYRDPTISGLAQRIDAQLNNVRSAAAS